MHLKVMLVHRISSLDQIQSEFHGDESSCMLDEDLRDISRVNRLVNLQTTSSSILKIVAQPDCPAKARYRKDYISPSNRRDPLGNKNTHSSYLGPAVQVDSFFRSHFAREVSSA